MILMNPKFITALVLVSGSAATYGAHTYMKQVERREQAVNAPITMIQPVVVATADLAVGTTLKAFDLETKRWPEEIVPVGAFQEVSLLEGRVVRTDVSAGEAILESKLAPTGAKGGVSGLIPEGMRALTVAVNVVSGVGGFILPKTRVDVLVTVDREGRDVENSARIILQNIEVLAVDQTYRKDGDDPITVKSVTLLVTPEDAEKLALASSEGKLQLALRGDTDSEIRETNGVHLSQFFRQKPEKPVYTASARTTRPAAKPKEVESPPAPPAKKVVEVIRANVLSEVELEGTQASNAANAVSPGGNGNPAP